MLLFAATWLLLVPLMHNLGWPAGTVSSVGRSEVIDLPLIVQRVDPISASRSPAEVDLGKTMNELRVFPVGSNELLPRGVLLAEETRGDTSPVAKPDEPLDPRP